MQNLSYVENTNKNGRKKYRTYSIFILLLYFIDFTGKVYLDTLCSIIKIFPLNISGSFQGCHPGLTLKKNCHELYIGLSTLMSQVM